MVSVVTNSGFILSGMHQFVVVHDKRVSTVLELKPAICVVCAVCALCFVCVAAQEQGAAVLGGWVQEPFPPLVHVAPFGPGSSHRRES